MSPNVGLGTGDGARGWSLWISSVVMVILAAAFVIPRIIHRATKQFLGWDDYFILAALITSIILSVTEIEAVVNGYGRHHGELPPERALTARKWFYGAQIAYKLVLMFSKMSISSMIYRIFKRSSKGFRICCHALQVLIVSSGVAFVLGTIFQCQPIHAFWNPSVPHKCFHQTPWWISYSVVQIITDVLLLMLPIQQVLLLNMSNTDKALLIVVFCTGTFTTITSIIRATTLATSSKNPDSTWGPIPATVWAVIEANCGIIAACLPLLRRPSTELVVQVRTWFQDLFRKRAPKQEPIRLNAAPKRYTGGHSANRSVRVTSQVNSSQENIFESKQSIYLTHDISVTMDRAEEGAPTNFGRFDAE